MDKKDYKINLKQNIIVSIVLLILSAIFLSVYNWSINVFAISANTNTTSIDICSFLSGMLYLSSIIVLLLSLYYKYKETNRKIYLIGVAISILLGVVLGWAIYKSVVLSAINNMLITIIIVYIAYKLFNMKESEFVLPFECITIIIVDISLFSFLILNISIHNQFINIVLWLFIFIIIYKLASYFFNSLGMYKTLGIAIIVLLLVAPALTILIRKFGLIDCAKKFIISVISASLFREILVLPLDVKIDIKILDIFLLAVSYWLFSVKIIQYSYKIYLSKENYDMRGHSILRFNRLFNILILLAVYFILKIVNWEEMGYEFDKIKDVNIAVDAITFLTLIILFTDERRKSSHYKKVKSDNDIEGYRCQINERKRYEQPRGKRRIRKISKRESRHYKRYICHTR